jgi:hypothetical protein
MRFLKLTSLAFFIVFSAACYLLSGKNLALKPDSNFAAPQNLQMFLTHHAQTFQKPNAENIKGDFERENHFELGGVKVEMSKNGADFFIAFERNGQKEIYKIEGIVGTENLEEYIAEKDKKFVRLPIAFDLKQKRWMNLNAAFFEADGADFFKHQKDWNAECAACHLENNNRLQDVEKLDSNAVLLACGSCHAKGLRDSFPKFDEIESKYSNDIISAHQNTPRGSPEYFEDGSVRLAAHEYQGILRSVCFVKNKGGDVINCLSCHSVENGEIVNIKADKKLTSPDSCTSCHQQFSTPDSIAEHTKHLLNSEASNCNSCHLPEVVYGHLKFQRTHEISIPNPELTAQKSVPNACNLCHTDKSVNWAITQSKTLWTEHFRDAKISNDAQFDEPEGIRGLFAGDAFTRALTADALKKHTLPEWFAKGFVLQAFKDEKYPLVRYFLANSLAGNENLTMSDNLNSPNKRPEFFSQTLKIKDYSVQNRVKIISRKLNSRRKKNELEIPE